MKRIAFVSDAVYPFNKGGKEMRLYELSRRLARRGYDVRVYTMKWWEGSDITWEIEGVTYVAICPLYPLYEGSRRSIKEGVMFGLACFNLLKYDFDILDVDHMPFFPLYSCRVVSWIKGVKLIGTWHEVWGRSYWKEYLGWKGEFAWWVEWVGMRLVDGVISVSEMTSTDFKSFRSNISISTIPNGIDWNSIQQTKASSISYDVVYAGRLLEHKNLDVLIKAVGRLKENDVGLKVLIVGEGPERESLERLSKTLKLTRQITFVDFYAEHVDLVRVMKSSKIFVLPSSREGFGLIVVEAHACGLPVLTVSEEKNAAQLLVNKKTGLVVSLNKEAIAVGIEKLLKAGNKNACIESAKGYEIEDRVDELEEYYEKFT